MCDVWWFSAAEVCQEVFSSCYIILHTDCERCSDIIKLRTLRESNRNCYHGCMLHLHSSASCLLAIHQYLDVLTSSQ